MCIFTNTFCTFQLYSNTSQGMEGLNPIEEWTKNKILVVWFFVCLPVVWGCVYVCVVCMRLWVQAPMCVCGGQRPMFNVFLCCCCSSLYALRQGLLLNRKLEVPDRLVGCKPPTPRISSLQHPAPLLSSTGATGMFHYIWFLGDC